MEHLEPIFWKENKGILQFETIKFEAKFWIYFKQFCRLSPWLEDPLRALPILNEWTEMKLSSFSTYVLMKSFNPSIPGQEQKEYERWALSSYQKTGSSGFSFKILDEEALHLAQFHVLTIWYAQNWLKNPESLLILCYKRNMKNIQAILYQILLKPSKI